MSFESENKSNMDETNVESKTKTLNSEFSPKDKLLLICSPLGGYSLLDKEKYQISFMELPQSEDPSPAEVKWDRLNFMLAEIANSGANALREFPWWCEHCEDTFRLVPYSYLNQKKYDLTQMDKNHYLQNQRKIAKLANRYGLTYIFSIYNGSEKRVKKAGSYSPWNGSNNIHNLSNFFYGEDAAPIREAWEMRLMAAFEDTDTLFELCNEPDPKGYNAMSETYTRLSNNNVHPSRILLGWDVFKKEKLSVYAEYYRQFRNKVTSNLDETYEQHIKKSSWSTIHKVNIETLQEYFQHGLEPGQKIPANSGRNIIYSTDGLSSPRPSYYDMEKITETIFRIKDKAVEAGRVGIEVVYGKEAHVDPIAGIKGVSSAFVNEFAHFPVNYNKYPEKLPLPSWIYDDETISPVKAPGIPKDLSLALELLIKPVLEFKKDIEDIVKVWPQVYPVMKKYKVIEGKIICRRFSQISADYG